jgi:hypothetical protein
MKRHSRMQTRALELGDPESSRVGLTRPVALTLAAPRDEPSYPTLAQAVTGLPALGARRLILIALQLATELELAHRSGISHAPLTAATVRLERCGTPFEQALLTRGPARPDAQAAESDLKDLGALLLQLLDQTPLFLEGSIWTRRADRDVLSALRRALTLIVANCKRAGAGARYGDAFDVTHDLAKLATIAGRIVAQRRPPPPRFSVHRPKPASAPWHETVPKVVVARTA